VPDQGVCERRELYYSGRVQGVGFRYTVRSLATRFAVAGFVRNSPDGRVELVVEGRPGEIRLFLDTVRAEIGHYVSGTQEQTSPATGGFQGFEIRF